MAQIYAEMHGFLIDFKLSLVLENVQTFNTIEAMKSTLNWKVWKKTKWDVVLISKDCSASTQVFCDL